jgi:hypothetical protein
MVAVPIDEEVRRCAMGSNLGSAYAETKWYFVIGPMRFLM